MNLHQKLKKKEGKMSKKIQHGGARQRAGRKPVADQKKTFTIYVEQSIIDANGGIDESKSECYLFLKKRGEKKKKN